MSPLVIREILGVSDNTVTADGKYPLWNCENLPLPIQMKLSNKTKNFFSFFFVLFLESESNFKLFEKKDDCQSQCISKLTDCERLG